MWDSYFLISAPFDFKHIYFSLIVGSFENFSHVSGATCNNIFSSIVWLWMSQYVVFLFEMNNWSAVIGLYNSFLC